MNRSKGLLAAALLAVVAVLGASAPATASPTLTYTITVYDANNTQLGTAQAVMDASTQSITSSSGGIWLVDPTSTPTGSILDFGGTLGGVAFSLSAQAASNTPGTASIAYLSTSYNSVTYNSASTAPANANRTFVLSVSANGYTAPVSPPLLDYMVSTSGTVNSGTLSGGSFNTTVGPFSSPTISISSTAAGGSLAMNPPSTAIDLTTSPYTMTATYTGTILRNTVLANGGGTLNLTPLPEPATVAGALMGLGFLGLMGYRRRRAGA